ncbi:hypothetical protein PanWU01x14_235820 [Parasponia andersonii]|uniref:Uncharacterized protein n=1 Tax=Parasponia andersonii TaxID=3476 RepID=A0A2P5BIT3_PARAD|nr:hypothetical protein PanWU01x14_235820 [Parasponia andersonii]
MEKREKGRTWFFGLRLWRPAQRCLYRHHDPFSLELPKTCLILGSLESKGSGAQVETRCPYFVRIDDS